MFLPFLKLVKGLPSRLSDFFVACILGTSAAFAFSFLAPGLKKASVAVRPYLDLPLRSTLILQIFAVLSMAILLAMVSKLPSRFARSLRAGLVPFETSIWTVSVILFWTFYEFSQPILGLSCIGFGAVLIGSARIYSQDTLKKTKTATPSLIEPDLPLPEGGEDLLDRRGLIDALLSYVLREQTAIVALTGRYGEGKTSLINLMIGELKKIDIDERPIIVRFSPWLAADSTALVLSLLESVVAEIETRFVVPGLGRDATRYARTLLGAIPRVDKLKEFFVERSQEQRINALTDHVTKTCQRVLVILDDLDRMQPEELETVFKILRGSDRLSTLTFLCSFDPSELSKILRVTRPEQATDVFLEKFFPIEVRVPETDAFELKTLSSRRFTAMVRRYAPDSTDAVEREIEEMWNEGAGQYLRNLRRLKLFLNNITHSLEQIAPEVNIFDFMRLELIRHIAPDVYEHIYRDRYIFLERGLAFETAYKPPYLDEKAAKEEREKYYQDLRQSVPEDRRYVFGIVASLFPQSASYFVGGRSRETPSSRDAEKGKRIFHPRCFRQYFSFKVPSEFFSQKEFLAFASKVSGQNEHQVAEIFTKTFLSLMDQSFRRFHFMHVLESHWNEFGTTEASGLCRGMARSSFPWVFDAFELGTAVDVTGQTLRQMNNSGDRQKLLNAVIRESTSPIYPLLLLRRLEEQSTDPLGVVPGTRFRAVGFDAENASKTAITADVLEAKSTLRGQMCKWYLTQNPPSVYEQFDSLGPNRLEPHILLLNWNALGEGAEVDQRNYLLRLFEEHPANLNRWMRLMFRVDFIDDYTALKSLIDYRHLSQLLTKNESLVDTGSLEKFRKRFNAEISPPPEEALPVSVQPM
jgi:hypothetical protein